jgi:hypothetical protein
MSQEIKLTAEQKAEFIKFAHAENNLQLPTMKIKINHLLKLHDSTQSDFIDFLIALRNWHQKAM